MTIDTTDKEVILKSLYNSLSKNNPSSNQKTTSLSADGTADESISVVSSSCSLASFDSFGEDECSVIVVEKSQEEKKKKTQYSVRFDENSNTTLEVTALEDVPLDMRADLWMTYDDIVEISETYKSVVRQMESGTLSPRDPSFRGLEERTRAGSESKFRVRYNAVNAVLNEQGRQWNENESDECLYDFKAISDAYRQYTTRCAREARLRGIQDERDLTVDFDALLQDFTRQRQEDQLRECKSMHDRRSLLRRSPSAKNGALRATSMHASCRTLSCRTLRTSRSLGSSKSSADSDRRSSGLSNSMHVKVVTPKDRSSSSNKKGMGKTLKGWLSI